MSLLIKNVFFDRIITNLRLFIIYTPLVYMLIIIDSYYLPFKSNKSNNNMLAFYNMYLSTFYKYY